eukprot:m.7451 g.7451  ORF g.7451 m.7451 type:complete len:305 (-) comp2807_c0_seq1:113-1027(-)
MQMSKASHSQTQSEELLLLSPLSRRACFKLNIKPTDLVPINIEEFVSSSSDILGFQKYRQAEDARIRLLKLVRMERAKMRNKRSQSRHNHPFLPVSSSPSYCENHERQQSKSITPSNHSKYTLSLEHPVTQPKASMVAPMMTGLSIRKQILMDELVRRQQEHHTPSSYSKDDFVQFVREMGDFDNDEEVCKMVAETRQRERDTVARMERALAHPSHSRSQISLCNQNHVKNQQNKDERRQSQRRDRVQTSLEKKQHNATIRKEQVLHVIKMRHHVEERFGIASVRHHPAFVSMNGDDCSCFFSH